VRPVDEPGPDRDLRERHPIQDPCASRLEATAEDVLVRRDVNLVLAALVVATIALVWL
jgi:hypothetical protein